VRKTQEVYSSRFTVYGRDKEGEGLKGVGEEGRRDRLRGEKAVPL
jgi:hypothetical protein